jgi:cell division protein FtsW
MSVLAGNARRYWRTLAHPDRDPDEETGRFVDKPYASVQLLLLVAVGLLGFGVMMAVSTTIAASDGASSQLWGQVVKEGEFIVIGVPLFWAAMRMSPRTFRFLAYPTLALATVALLAVLVPGVGVQINGARRWIDVGPLQLQPSELAKLAVLLWGADLLARKQQLGTLRRARHLFVPLVPGFGFVVLLVMLEPDLGTTLCFMLILLGLLWMIGMPIRYFGLVVLMVAGAVTLLTLIEPWRIARLTAFTDPFKDASGAGYHTVESLYALGSGGLWGVGLGDGTSKYWVPNANSDYVFAIIGEELGLLGALAVLVLFGLFAYTGMRIARRNADPFVRLAAGTATIWLCGQAVINIGYVTGLLPVTGIPLPFISAGGTSLLVSFFVLGMLTSFARHEAPAVAVARKAERFGRRSRVERWLRVPVPRPYAPPKRRRQSHPRGVGRTDHPSAVRVPPPVRASPAGEGRTARAQAASPRAARSSRERSSPVGAPSRGAATQPRVSRPAAVPLRATGTDGSRRGR